MLLWFQTERNHSLYSEACNGYSAHFEKPVVLFFIFLSCLLYRQESVIDAEVFGARKWLTKSMNRLFWPCGTALFFPWWSDGDLLLYFLLMRQESCQGVFPMAAMESLVKGGPLPFRSATRHGPLSHDWQQEQWLLEEEFVIHWSVFCSQSRHRLAFRKKPVLGTEEMEAKEINDKNSLTVFPRYVAPLQLRIAVKEFSMNFWFVLEVFSGPPKDLKVKWSL